MPRESELYRAYREQLNEYFDHEELTQKEVAVFLGKDPRTVRNRYGVTKTGITRTELASKMAKRKH